MTCESTTKFWRSFISCFPEKTSTANGVQSHGPAKWKKPLKSKTSSSKMIATSSSVRTSTTWSNSAQIWIKLAKRLLGLPSTATDLKFQSTPRRCAHCKRRWVSTARRR
eukprot:PhF_6_TR25469/c0_g1_i1/m.35354